MCAVAMFRVILWSIWALTYRRPGTCIIEGSSKSVKLKYVLRPLPLNRTRVVFVPRTRGFKQPLSSYFSRVIRLLACFAAESWNTCNVIVPTRPKVGRFE
ncbi:hypothetical protein DEU56DRAFT_794467 [Suillus clintonianus]|uniref:uncharacterized protein n=1 Tax=Suillus clintonianus TaxID=1904413 RepID=UPI001B87FFB8|nr:uncharacterized protein DEU56DRAFT_794467 [Suillus clintonianus]KAG2142444.1 hypothetical protein DEU56DRAFT_794467 [Suillus clintonianus]